MLENKTLIAYLLPLIIVVICTLVGNALSPYIDSSSVMMLYLLGVIFIATSDSERQAPAIIAALLSTLAYDFFFIPHYLSLKVSDIQYFFTLVMMLIVTQAISHLTKRTQRQSEAVRKAKMQAEAERLRNILLTSISHDFRTPLTAIMGSASTLLEAEQLNTDMVKELAKNIYEESKHLNYLVTNVLQAIRLEARTVKISRQPQSLDEIINAAIERLTERLGNLKITLHIDEPMPCIPLDHILMEQVITNLIENAFKYSCSTLPIKITARMHGKNAVVEIADRGQGLNPDDLEHIFDKYYRTQESENHHDGFGLGLAICKDIIQLHGGKIWAENHKEGGAIFLF